MVQTISRERMEKITSQGRLVINTLLPSLSRTPKKGRLVKRRSATKPAIPMEDIYAKLEQAAPYIERNPAIVKSIASFPHSQIDLIWKRYETRYCGHVEPAMMNRPAPARPVSWATPCPIPRGSPINTLNPPSRLCSACMVVSVATISAGSKAAEYPTDDRCSANVSPAGSAD
jgi:hypothetical protein